MHLSGGAPECFSLPGGDADDGDGVGGLVFFFSSAKGRKTWLPLGGFAFWVVDFISGACQRQENGGPLRGHLQIEPACRKGFLPHEAQIRRWAKKSEAQEGPGKYHLHIVRPTEGTHGGNET